MKASDTFWDSAADKYARKPVGDEAAYAKTLERTSTHLAPKDHVLEVGCGTGTTALKLAPLVARITGTDISGRMIEIATEKANEQNITNVRFAKETTETLLVQETRFDVVTAFNMLHLMEAPAQTVHQIHDLIKPGGLFISKTPCLAEKMKFLRPIIWVMQKIGMAPMVHFIGYVELDDMMRDAGFEIIESGVYPAKTGSRFLVAKRR